MSEEVSFTEIKKRLDELNSQIGFFDKNGHLKTETLSISNSKNFSLLDDNADLVKDLESSIAYREKTTPVQSTSFLNWITGSLNVISFGFFDWISNGAISSFDRQKQHFLSTFNEESKSLVKSLNHAKWLFQRDYNQVVKHFKAKFDGLIIENSETFEEKFSKLGEKRAAEDYGDQYLSFIPDDNDQDGQINFVNGMKEKSEFDETDMEIFDERRKNYTFTSNGQATKEKPFDTIDFSAAPEYGVTTHPLFDSNKAREFVTNVMNEASQKLGYFHDNYKALVASQKSVEQILEKYKGNTSLNISSK